MKRKIKVDIMDVRHAIHCKDLELYVQIGYNGDRWIMLRDVYTGEVARIAVLDKGDFND